MLWSLWVEVQFYAVVGLLLVVARRRLLEATTLVAVGLTALLAWRPSDSPELAQHLWWFVFGMALYSLWCRRQVLLATGIAAVAVVGQLAVSLSLSPLLADRHLSLAVFLLGLFSLGALSVFWAPLGRVLSWRPATRVGEASYSLYLLHQAVGVTLIVWLGRQLSWRGSSTVLLAVVVTAGLVGASLLVQRWVEVPSQRWLLDGTRPWRGANPPVTS